MIKVRNYSPAIFIKQSLGTWHRAKHFAYMWPGVLMTTEPQVTGKEIKVQRSQVTCSRSHSWSGLGQDNVQGSTAPQSTNSPNHKHVSPHASRCPQLHQRFEAHVFQGEQAVDRDSLTRTFEREDVSPAWIW